MPFSLLMFIIVSNVVLCCLKLLEFAFLFKILEIVLYLMLVPRVKSCPHLLQRLYRTMYSSFPDHDEGVLR
jgi:hypothetical protein